MSSDPRDNLFYSRFSKDMNLNESQWWTLNKLKQFQNERLQEIVKYAYENIPAYKQKIDEARIKPNDIRSLKDLSQIPITTRDEMQNNPSFLNEKLISRALHTGGSTGASLKFYESEESGKIRWESHLRGWSWNGYYPGKRLSVISSARGTLQKENTLNLIGDLTAENLSTNVAKLLEFKPQHIRGYVSSIYILAKYCLDNRINLDGVESINPISENLYDFQREVIEKAFHCKVFEEYCCNDGGACAWECEAHEGLHYFMERAIIEDVDGDMIVTDLWNTAMPFIRYRNGDSIMFLNRECQCGRKLPLIKVKGRSNDIIITPVGPVSPTYILHSWYDGSKFQDGEDFRLGISISQYIQKPGYKLFINIVRTKIWNDRMMKLFKKETKRTFKGMDITINFVDDVIKTAKGKRHFIINEDEELLKKVGYVKL